MADLFADEADDTAPQGDSDLLPGITPLPIDPERRPPAGNSPWRLLEERRLDPKRSPHRGYRRTRDFRVSPTDPDASSMWDCEAFPGRDGVGTTKCPLREPGGPSGAVRSVLSCLRVITS